jgi:hypothetical protein
VSWVVGREVSMDAERILVGMPQIPLEEQEKYKGMDVAIIDGRIVAAGYSSFEVYQKARELFPEKEPEEILISYITKPEADFLVL